jgi:SAM-dependent methyltransferase
MPLDDDSQTGCMSRRASLADVGSACLSCGAIRLHPLRRYRVQTRAGKTLFGASWLRECSSCGLVQALPRPDAAALAAYYSNAYWEATRGAADLADLSLFPKDNLALFNRGQALADLIAAHARMEPATILDIGAGLGHVLHALSERYPAAASVAVESSDACQRHLRSLGIHVSSDPIEQFLSGSEARFDVIVLSHTLEHFLDPRMMLSAIQRSLAPGGLLSLEVPNIPAESKGRLIDHQWASPYDEPHITFFSASTLGALVKQAGYTILLCDTAGPEYCRYRPSATPLRSVRSVLRQALPRWALTRLRKQRARMASRDESFYQYGGSRIWIRCVAARR